MHSSIPVHSSQVPLPEKCLVLSVTSGIFDEIRTGARAHEYRPHNYFWKRQIVCKSFTHVANICGITRTKKIQKMMVFEWRGYEVRTVQQGRSYTGATEKAEVFAVSLAGTCDTFGKGDCSRSLQKSDDSTSSHG